ncbi:MAG TPA: hypothetical protein PKE63_08400 [Lacibacter sp.]|nr:hypothetical protein [Lacibacter sp.]HMO88387.1 hypothetical protein [Lacibacter sp.]HMP87285.1 hypothetical protein [Lacibacter sp.]
MKNLHLFFLLPLIAVMACTATQRTGKDTIPAVELRTEFDKTWIDDGHTERIKTAMYIYQTGDFMIYKEVVALEEYEGTLDPDPESDKIYFTLTRDSSVYRFWVYNMAEQKGIVFGHFDTIPPRPFALDTFLQKKGLIFPRLINPENDSLLERTAYKDGRVIRRHTPRVKYDNSYNATLTLYYERPQGLYPFSFSPEQDTLRNRKLVKFEILFHAYRDTLYGLDVPERHFASQLIPIKNPDTAEINRMTAAFRANRHLL